MTGVMSVKNVIQTLIPEAVQVLHRAVRHQVVVRAVLQVLRAAVVRAAQVVAVLVQVVPRVRVPVQAHHRAVRAVRQVAVLAVRVAEGKGAIAWRHTDTVVRPVRWL